MPSSDSSGVREAPLPVVPGCERMSALDNLIGHRYGSEDCHIFGSRPVTRTRQPPFLQGLLSLILQMTGPVAERERLKKGDDDRFLFGGQCPEAGRIPIGRA